MLQRESRTPESPVRETRAVVETRLMHGVHRRATSVLADAAGRDGVPDAPLAELRRFVVGTLRHHHESEDHRLWPLLTADAPHLTAALAVLTREHEQLDLALDALDAVPIRGAGRGSVHAPAAAVRDLVHDHLVHEEPILFPALRAHVSAAAWVEFSRDVVASAPVEGGYLMFGFLDAVGPAEDVELVVDTLPGPARELVPAMREDARSTLDALGRPV
jgi:hypothetical protein